MKVVSYTALHYGADYLYYAIKSVIDYVDEHWIIYSDVGSHGSRTSMRCPDTREQLMEIAAKAAGDKLGWVDGRWNRETDQRSMIHQIAPNADVILVVDADEIWTWRLLDRVFHYIRQDMGKSSFRLPIIHYWRSFYRCILHDPVYPQRVVFPHNQGGEWSLGEPHDLASDYQDSKAQYINHMGYAQRPEIVRYKLETHGHRAEFRQDVDWFNDVFMANRQTDCHPVGSEYWNPEIVNPWDYLPDFMRSHPFANREIIE